MKLYDVSRQYAKNGRLKEIYENLSDVCESHNEEAEDVFFPMLKTTLFDKGKAELAKTIHSLRTGQTENVLTVDECLANRIVMLQMKNQFIYKPPYSLDKIEETYNGGQKSLGHFWKTHPISKIYYKRPLSANLSVYKDPPPTPPAMLVKPNSHHVVMLTKSTKFNIVWGRGGERVDFGEYRVNCPKSFDLHCLKSTHRSKVL